jgi:peptidoglycan/xylan/chitin deacetylase (PgdA/CDA1 family)
MRCQVLYWLSERFTAEKRAWLRLSLRIRRLEKWIERITGGRLARALTIALLLVILYQTVVLVNAIRDFPAPLQPQHSFLSVPSADLAYDGEWITVAGSAPGFSVAVLLMDGREQEVCTIQEGLFSFRHRPEENSKSVQVQVYGDSLPAMYTRSIPIAGREDVGPGESKVSTDREREAVPVPVRAPHPVVTVKRSAVKAPRHLQLGDDLSRGHPDTGTVAITFDGGSYGNAATRILDALAKRDLKATFFLTGEFMNRYPEITRRIATEGHEVGNHMFSHPHLTTFAKNLRQETLPGVTRELVLDELAKNEELFFSLTGNEMVKLWRAPYGEQNETIRKWAGKEGYRHVSWTYDPKTRKSLDGLDWVSDRDSALYLSSDQIINKILSFDETEIGLAGGIVLLHLGSERSTDPFYPKLGRLLDRLQEKGYKVGSVGDLLEKGG